MGRAFAAVIVGYITMFLVVVVGTYLAYRIMGGNQAFLPGKWEPSLRWVAVASTLDLAAAIIGGWVCMKIDRSPTRVYVLIGVVLVLGAVGTVLEMVKAAPTEPRTSGAFGFFEAMQKGHRPVWVSALYAVLAAIGVWIGGMATRRKSAA